MKLFFTALLCLLIAMNGDVFAQKTVDKAKLFADTAMVNATLNLNIKKLLAKRNKQGLLFPANFICKMSDSLIVNDNIELEARGHFRRGYCYLPPLKLVFKNNPSCAFYRLKGLKLVAPCSLTDIDDQNLLKEYLTYKIFNLITDMSFRVRLLNLTYVDSSGRRTTFTKHAFLLEDIKEVAKRNACTDWSDKKFFSEGTNRRQMTITNIFEYMIGNTDWAVPVNHNIKLIHSKTDSLSRPYVVPYDFDFSGLVATNYSTPNEKLGIETVQQRLYRGFPRSMAELNDVLDIFKGQKQNVYAVINNFRLLSPVAKKDMIDYLESFYKTINNPAEVQQVFITNARTE